MSKLSELLSSAENGRSGHEDLLGAAGLAAIDQPMGSALQRALSTGRGSDAERVVECLEADARIAAIVLSPIRKRLLLRAAVRVWLNPVCPSCHGRGFSVIKDTPHLSDQPCQSCDATGRLTLRFPGVEGNVVGLAQDKMDGAFERFERTLSRKLGRDK